MCVDAVQYNLTVLGTIPVICTSLTTQRRAIMTMGTALCAQKVTYPARSKNVLECCIEHAGYIGDGCSGESYNTEACGWDGGDCCEETCENQ